VHSRGSGGRRPSRTRLGFFRCVCVRNAEQLCADNATQTLEIHTWYIAFCVQWPAPHAGWPAEINAREFALMVDRAGMTPAQSILAGTRVAAELLQLPSVGRIAIGAEADLVVCSGNPLDDIRLLETAVTTVVKGGKIVRGSS
jgi:hypothetical protein